MGKSKVMVILVIFGIFFLPLFNLNLVRADSQNIYYISSEGDDSNDGLSPASAWKTINKLNSELNGGVINSGDDIYFRRGDFFNDEGLNIDVGGSVDNRMIIGSYGSGNYPILNGTSYNLRFSASEVSYVSIRNLSLENSTSTSVVATFNLSNIILENLTIKNSGHNGIFFDNTIDLLIRNCNVFNASHSGIVLYGSKYNRLSNVIVEHTFINGSGPEDALCIHGSDSDAYDVGSNFLLENVTCTGFGEQAFDLTSGENITLKNCEGYNNGDSSILIGYGVKNITIDNFYSHHENVNTDTMGIIVGECDHVIIRNCRIYDPSYHLITVGTGGSKNVYIYNNDLIFDNGKDGSIIDVYNSAGATNNIVFKNNIILSLDNSKPTNRFLRYLSPASLSNTSSGWNNNIWWRGNSLSGDERWWTDDNEYQTYSNWLSKSQVSGDMREDPKIDPINDNWNLSNGSPCIDNGTWLTFTTSSGSGSVISVLDSKYFSSGSSLSEGDIIKIGSNSLVKVLDVDYLNNILIVNKSINWNINDSVSFEYYGSGIDIGAFEYIVDTTQNQSLPEINNVNLLSSDPIDTNTTLGWINITASVLDDDLNLIKLNYTNPNGVSTNVSMVEENENGFYYNTTFNLYGNYTYLIWCNDTSGNENISQEFIYSMPPNWDINADGICSVLDNVLISNHYNETGSNGWIREDVDNNGKINVLDLVLISNHQGENWKN